MTEELAEQVAGVGALVEPARRALYLYVASEPDAVSREQAAAAVELPVHSAKFHLDRLVEEGLLDVEFRRLSGRTGPGAGRPSKLYRRSARQLSVSLPERHYDLAGDVLAAAIDRSVRDGVPVQEAVRVTAAEQGRRIAAAYVEEAGAERAGAPGAPAYQGGAEAGGRHSAEDAGRGGDDLGRTADVLSRHGYEPRTADDEVCLANCPFDRLATEHTELVCGMNLALIDGVIEGLDAGGVGAELAPQPGFCCVKVSRREAVS
ncbi:helix-turn-helix transcriptional regulator [Nocardioides mesophilus]|uniref:Transcriptional regulator n=1 Tax=Nocardioides mesophilus TaxID=433659 RepID=A0A7G9RED6_9ACTN|nr:helix-turn-helix domain-containing protein [Nocardioides mesophilus]QNN53961.1 transcriptional regulator [Nocardioides mesophilus]